MDKNKLIEMLENTHIGAKNAKKEINLNRTQTIVFFCFFILFFAIVAVGITSIISPPEHKFSCTDGTIEPVQQGKLEYCGQNYSIIQNYVSDKEFKKIEKIIFAEN
jgi:hypothetical protein